jgi:hypothetical protein
MARSRRGTHVDAVLELVEQVSPVEKVRLIERFRAIDVARM